MWINVDGLACYVSQFIENGFVLKMNPLTLFGDDGKLVYLDKEGTMGMVKIHMPQTYGIISGEDRKYERN